MKFDQDVYTINNDTHFIEFSKQIRDDLQNMHNLDIISISEAFLGNDIHVSNNIKEIVETLKSCGCYVLKHRQFDLELVVDYLTVGADSQNDQKIKFGILSKILIMD